MSTVRLVFALLLVVVLVVMGGAFYALRAPQRDDLAGRTGTWLRAQLHVAPKGAAAHGEALLAVTASQDRVFAVARDPSMWVRAMTHIERDPDAEITTTGLPGEVGFVYAWSSTSSETEHPRGSVTITSLEPSSLVGVHLALGSDVGDAVIHPSAAQLVVTVDLVANPKAALTATSVAELVASAVRSSLEPHAAAAASSPDLGVASRPTVAWHVRSCKNAPGCTQNGFTRTCGEAGMKTIGIVVTDERTHKKVVTHAPCPSAASDGEVAIEVPPGKGPFTLSATSSELATARSELVCHITPRCWERGVSLSLYALGCNDPECTACSDVGHAPGWCE